MVQPMGCRDLFVFFRLLRILLRVQRQLNSQQRLGPGTVCYSDVTWHMARFFRGNQPKSQGFSSCSQYECGHFGDIPCSDASVITSLMEKPHAFPSCNSPKPLAKRSFKRLHTSQCCVTGTGVLTWALTMDPIRWSDHGQLSQSMVYR